ncbi:MAG TPA: LysR substrate-binding domain-containing protein [Gemmatimonadaceae bacterium]|nr:LysR substrate-binding domain-containing protein [Gemmatimonadaceae bacterium]
MELRHLRYLIAVAEERSFVGAAARLGLAQPALSRQIRDLEHEIGTDLFIREASGTRPTPSGDECVRTARAILDDVAAALQRARLAEHGLVGRCVLGAGRYPLWNGLLARIVDQAKTDYPGIDVVIQEFSDENQWQALADAQVDIAFGTAPLQEAMQLATETHSLDVLDAIVVSRTHPLASRTSVKLRDLEGETWLRYAPGIDDEATKSFQSVLTRLGFTPSAKRMAVNLDALRMLVRSGAGWMALPRSMRNSLNNGLVAIPLDDLAVPFRYVVMQRRNDARPAVRSILRSIRRTAQREPDVAMKEPPSGIRALAASEAARTASKLELRHLRYFTAIVQYESIGRAAEALELTQPALSRQLRDLEQEVGVTLLTRTSRGVVPTLAGESLNQDALAILRSAARLPSEAQRVVRGTAGDCVVGLVPSPLIWETLTSAVAEIATRLPAINVRLEEIPTPAQATALREARLDIGLGHRQPTTMDLDPNIVRELLLPDAMATALVSERHPLAMRKAIVLADLHDSPLLFMERQFSPALYDYVMSTFARTGFTPRVDGEYNGLSTVWALAAQGLGWCIGTQSQLAFPPASLVAIPIRDFHVPWGIEVSYRGDERRAPVLEVIQSLRHAARELDASMASQENKYWSDLEASA